MDAPPIGIEDARDENGELINWAEFLSEAGAGIEPQVWEAPEDEEWMLEYDRVNAFSDVVTTITHTDSAVDAGVECEELDVSDDEAAEEEAQRRLAEDDHAEIPSKPATFFALKAYPEAVRQMHEEYFFRVTITKKIKGEPGYSGWGKWRSNNEWEPVKKEKVLDECSSFKYLDSDGKEQPFLPRYMTDDTVTRYVGFSYDPYNKDGSLLTLLPAFRASTLPKIGRRSTVLRLVQPIVDFFEGAVEDSGQREILIAVFANVLQRPMEKSELISLLEGRPGCGKNIILQKCFGPLVLGGARYKQVPGAAAAFQAFSDARRLRNVLVMDEVTQADTRQYAEFIKDLATQDTVEYRKTYSDPVTFRNFTNVFMTTNNKRMVYITPGDRRFWVAEFTNRRLRTQSKYYKHLAHYIQRPVVVRAFYEYLKYIVDIRKYVGQWQEMRPLGDAYWQTVQMNTNPFYSFMSMLTVQAANFHAPASGEIAYNEHRGVVQVQHNALLDIVKDWMRRAHFTRSSVDFLTGGVYASQIEQLRKAKVVIKARIDNRRYMLISIPKLLHYLQVSQQYDGRMTDVCLLEGRLS